MCNFKSAIVIQDLKSKGGYRLLLSPWTESHSELELIFKLREGVRLNYAKVEFSPESMATSNRVETYKLRIDEQREPEWFDAEMKESVSGRMADYIKSIIVTGDCSILIGGQFIIAPGASVRNVRSALVMAVLGNATVSGVWGNATVSDVRDNAKVSDVRGNATVSDVWGNATVSDVRDNAKVSDVWGNATVSDVWGNAKVENDHRVKK